ncbi:DMT family transporter [Polycladidibacter stylochi]|uniref:DMT family transporter n=1 Tax=Polycladidibacter stylochi TaxID=1807766 RepID=UPI00083600B1|nr:DMT family transporter [Pseudovibrio stylochi]
MISNFLPSAPFLLTVTALILSSISLGSLGFFGKLAAEGNISSALLLFIRFFLPGFLLAYYLPRAYKVPREALRQILLGALMATGVYLFFLSLSSIDLTNALCLYMSTPLFYWIASSPSEQSEHRIRLRLTGLLNLVAVVLIAIKITITSANEQSGSFFALALCLFSPCFYSIVNAHAKPQLSLLSGKSAAACLFLGATVASILFLATELLFRTSTLNLADTPFVFAGVVFFSGALPFFLLLVCVCRRGTGLEKTTSLIELASGCLLAFLAVKEEIHLLNVSALLLLAIALYLCPRVTPTSWGERNGLVIESKH